QEGAQDLFVDHGAIREDFTGRDEGAHRGRRELVRKHGNRVVTFTRVEGEVLHAVGRDPAFADHDLVVRGAGGQGHVADVEERELRHLDAAYRAGDDIRLGAGDEQGLLF